MSPSFPPPIRVLVLHADAIVAFGLAAALGAHADFHVRVGGLEAGADADADDKLIVCDHDTALALARRPRRAPATGPQPRLLVITAQDRERAVRLALETGVHGYMLQGCPVEELVQGARAVARGQRFLSVTVAQRMADSLTREPLTGRETEVLDLLGSGHCNKSIARELGIALGTVKAHVKAVLSKLDARSRTQAVSVALQRGLVRPRSPDTATAPRRGVRVAPALSSPFAPSP